MMKSNLLLFFSFFQRAIWDEMNAVYFVNEYDAHMYKFQD